MNMNISDYKFELGDEVITISGKRGTIVRVCDCEMCAARGFYEPVYLLDGENHEDYISNLQAKLGFLSFYKIGKYYFNEFDRDDVSSELKWCEKQAEILKKRLAFMDKVEAERNRSLGGDV